jgi:hypothetical protein
MRYIIVLRKLCPVVVIPLKKSHSGNVQQNVDAVVVLAVSSSRSDLIQHRKW